MQLQVGVKVLIRNPAGSYLLLTRSADYDMTGGGDDWDIPGGRIDPTEELLIALRREVVEETGVSLPAGFAPELLAAQDIMVQAKSLHVVRLTYRLDADISEVTVSGEHTGYQWATLQELKQFSLEPYLAAVVRDLN